MKRKMEGTIKAVGKFDIFGGNLSNKEVLLTSSA
jgi:hypothetical protein